MFKIPYRGNLTWLTERTILFVRHGSHAYGTNIASSDEDFKGAAIAPKEYYHGFVNTFEQAESHDPDLVIYELKKFMRLAADCNPSIIEVLWADPNIVTPAGQKLIDAREMFLSRKAKHTFSGYALGQLKRIRTHHNWLTAPPKTPPTRAELGLPEHTVIAKDQLAAAHSAIGKKLLDWNLDGLDSVDPAARILLQTKMAECLAEANVSNDNAYTRAGRTIGIDDNFLRLLDLERQYRARKVGWEQYENWKATRNPARAELEAKWGYDTKHAMHLVRLLRMCREILERGEVLVRRPDAEELLSIRAGAWSYEQLVEWAEREDVALNDVAAASPLPRTADRAALDALCIRMVEASS